MLASLNFIEKFISLPKKTLTVSVNSKTFDKTVFDTEHIETILTRQGFEVESIRQFGGEFDTLVVGRIERVEPHPDAQKLNICFVQLNEGDTLRQIVCGARNVRTNMFVAVALPGTKLPARGAESRDASGKLKEEATFEIKSSVIRGVNSDGMLCARSELGLSVNENVDGNGIWDLEDDAQGGAKPEWLAQNLGAPVFATLGLEDTLLELNVTPNRPDMLCQRGVARELAAGFSYANIPFETKCFDFSVNSSVTSETILNDVKQNGQGKCGNSVFSAFSYAAVPAFFILFEFSQSQPKTPAWLRNLLEPLNQNSINLIVDISNFILVAYGQPNHAFDLDTIDSGNPTNKKLIVRHAHPNEMFVGLDGKERTLHTADCVVSDTQTPHALLGVIGGEQSKITERTTRIVVEFANPNQAVIRHTARRHSKHTVASFMFEKGVDAGARFHAAAEFASLLSHLTHHTVQYTGGVHAKNMDQCSMAQTDFSQVWLPLHEQDQIKILGANLVPFSMQMQILNALGFETMPFEKTEPSQTMVSVPTWRQADVVGTADLVEEFIRVVGIDHVPPVPMTIQATVNNDDSNFVCIQKLCAQLSVLGYHEVAGLHFMRADDWQKLNLNSSSAFGAPVELLNPILGDEPFLQTTLIPDLLRKVERNLNYGIKSGQLFHSARTFCKSDTYDASASLTNSQSPVQETHTLAGVCFGHKMAKTWQNANVQSWSLHDVMMHIIETVKTLNINLTLVPHSAQYAGSVCARREERRVHNAVSGTQATQQRSASCAGVLCHPKKFVECIAQFSSNNEKHTRSIGWLGELHPKVKRNYGLDGSDVYVFELNVSALLSVASAMCINAQDPAHARTGVASAKYSNPPRFPLVSRDFSFIVDEHVLAEYIERSVHNALEPILKPVLQAELKDIRIFDVYRGSGVEEGKKSLTFQVVVQPLQNTFTENEIQTFSNCVMDAMCKDLDAKFRT